MRRLRHLSRRELIDLVEDHADARARAHAAGCPRCVKAAAELRDAIALASQDNVPEPSPLFWDHLSMRIATAVAEERSPGSRRWQERWALPVRWRRRAALAAAVAAMAVVAGVTAARFASRHGEETQQPRAQVVAPDVEPDSRMGDDGIFEVLSMISAGLSDDGEALSALSLPLGTAERGVAELNRDEQDALIRLLEAELTRRPS